MQPVSANAVLEQMSETYREYLDGIDLNTFPPEAKLKEFRGAVRQAEEQEAYLQGNIDSFEEASRTAEQKLSELYADKAAIEKKRKVLSDKQFEGIEVEDLSIQRNMLLEKLSSVPKGENPKVTQLQEKIEELRHKPYVSKYTQAMAENAAEVKTYRNGIRRW